MTVPFNSIPSDLRVPLFYAELDNSAANTATEVMRRLLIAQVNDDASHEAIGKLTLVSRTSEAVAIGGAGSMLANMHETFRRNDPFGAVWCLPLRLTTGIAATATVTITGTASAAGLLYLYVAGQRVQAIVPRAASAAAAAEALATAINAAGSVPVKAAAVAGVVTLTAKFKGVLGNDVQLTLNLLGSLQGEITPAGLTVAVTAMAGGAGAPEPAEVLAAIGDAPFEFIGQPWTDATTLDAWAEFMGTTAGRWSWSKQLYGRVYTAKRGTLGTLVALGSSRNDPFMTISGFESPVQAPAWAVASAHLARTAVFIGADPARPTQTGILIGMDAAPESARFDLGERQSLLENGIATLVYEGGAQRIERAITTYRVNAYGQADNSYMDSEPLHQSAYVLRFIRSRISSKFGRHKLANDGTRFAPGQAIVTPKTIRAELIAGYGELERNGLVENAEAFSQHLVVERDSSSPNRLNVLCPPDLVNQLRVFALLYQFRLQYPEAA